MSARDYQKDDSEMVPDIEPNHGRGTPRKPFHITRAQPEDGRSEEEDLYESSVPPRNSRHPSRSGMQRLVHGARLNSVASSITLQGEQMPYDLVDLNPNAAQLSAFRPPESRTMDRTVNAVDVQAGPRDDYSRRMDAQSSTVQKAQQKRRIEDAKLDVEELQAFSRLQEIRLQEIRAKRRLNKARAIYERHDAAY